MTCVTCVGSELKGNGDKREEKVKEGLNILFEDSGNRPSTDKIFHKAEPIHCNNGLKLKVMQPS